MNDETTVAAFEQNPEDAIARVEAGSAPIVINRDGRPVAALIDARLFERIRRARQRFDELSARLASGYANVPEEQGAAEIASVVREERSRFAR